MNTVSTPMTRNWQHILLNLAREHSLAALGLAIALAAVLALLVQSLVLVLYGNAPLSVQYGLLEGLAGSADHYGSLPALVLRQLPLQVEDTMMGLAAEAMLFVVSHEVIPDSHRNGHQKFATLGLMTGFALMMVPDTTLG